MSLEEPLKKQVVLLIHGIRDFALWQTTIANVFEESGIRAELINYGYFNLIKFLFPFPFFRNAAINMAIRQIRIVRQNNDGAEISIIAHSFGTYIVSRILSSEFDFRFHRVVFCGSVVEYDFPFEQFQNRFISPIVNEVGTRDPWPAIAESISLSYGSAGTYSFRRPLVKDRLHNKAGHGYFLDSNFCKKYWIPLLLADQLVAGEIKPEKPKSWITFLSIVKLRWAIPVTILLIIFAALVPNIHSIRSYFSFQDLSIPDPLKIGSTQNLRNALAEINARDLNPNQKLSIVIPTAAGSDSFLEPQTSPPLSQPVIGQTCQHSPPLVLVS